MSDFLPVDQIPWRGRNGSTPHRSTPPAPAPKGKAAGLDLISIGDLLAEPDELVEFVVEGLIGRGSVNVLSAKPKVGKSTLARHLALAVARGDDFLGRRCPELGVVWFLAFEGTRRDIRKAFRKLGATADDPIRLFIGAAPAKVIADVRAQATREQPALIVIDTMQRFLRAKDLNDYSETTLLFDHVIQIAQQSKAALLLLTHNSKTQRDGLDAILGSTAIAGSVDTAILLTRTDRYRTISTVQRTGEDLTDTLLRMNDRGHVELAGSRHLADVEHLREQFLDVLARAGAPVDRQELLELVEGRRTEKLKALKSLVSENPGTTGTTNVQVTGQGKRNDPFRYVISGSVVPPRGGNHKSTLLCDQPPQALNPGKGGSRTCTGAEPPPEPPISGNRESDDVF